jgi:predicted NAD-dependent protein-ADP-ribosyltransferase YbiA (DUF1768 family)
MNEELTYVYDGMEFHSKEEMMSHVKSKKTETKTENKLLDEILHDQFPNHDREVFSHLRRLKNMKNEKTTVMDDSERVKGLEMKDRIHELFKNFDEFLVEKNRRYGNSVGQKQGTFFKGGNLDGILIRMDDKLSRIRNNPGEPRRNDFMDLMGYIALYCCQKSDEDPTWLDPRVDLD